MRGRPDAAAVRAVAQDRGRLRRHRAHQHVAQTRVHGHADNHPDYVDHVFTRHHDRYVKHEGTIELVSGEPVALPLLEGQEWKRVRTAFNPHFGERALAAATPLMMEGITDRVEAWRQHRLVRGVDRVRHRTRSVR